ncbi:MAG: ComF family protein [Deltaproteobacteria bacterium]|nr:ComF family protein [Deltaproteobacteria bacterium]
MKEMGLVHKFIDFILPRICVLCEKYSSHKNICKNCIEEITFIKPPLCYGCGIPFLTEQREKAYCGKCLNQKNNIRKIRSLFLYEEVTKNLLWEYKFNKKIFLKKDFLKFILENKKHIDFSFENYDFFIPVPLHEDRFLERNYNQALMIAEELSRHFKVPILKNVLLKTKITLPQSHLSQKERSTNLKKSFEIRNKSILKNKTILLIDDIRTTGSTLLECSKVLKLKTNLKIMDAFTLALTTRLT